MFVAPLLTEVEIEKSGQCLESVNDLGLFGHCIEFIQVVNGRRNKWNRLLSRQKWPTEGKSEYFITPTARWWWRQTDRRGSLRSTPLSTAREQPMNLEWTSSRARQLWNTHIKIYNHIAPNSLRFWVEFMKWSPRMISRSTDSVDRAPKRITVHKSTSTC